MVEVTAKDGTTTLEGYCIDMLRKIANSSRFHLHYRIQKRNDNAYGNNKTGVWDGMIGDLINGVGEQQHINKRKHLNNRVVVFNTTFNNISVIS